MGGHVYDTLIRTVAPQCRRRNRLAWARGVGCRAGVFQAGRRPRRVAAAANTWGDHMNAICRALATPIVALSFAVAASLRQCERHGTRPTLSYSSWLAACIGRDV